MAGVIREDPSRRKWHGLHAMLDEIDHGEKLEVENTGCLGWLYIHGEVVIEATE